MAEDDAKPAAAAAAAADDDDSDVEMSGECEDNPAGTRRRRRHIICPVSFPLMDTAPKFVDERKAVRKPS